MLSVSALVLALIALSVCAICLRRLNMHSATIARLSSEVSNAVASRPLTPSLLAELAEFHEALKRAEELLVKLNQREAVAASRRRRADGTYLPSSGPVSKEELRMRAGLVAGRPAPHS